MRQMREDAASRPDSKVKCTWRETCPLREKEIRKKKRCCGYDGDPTTCEYAERERNGDVVIEHGNVYWCWCPKRNPLQGG